MRLGRGSALRKLFRQAQRIERVHPLESVTGRPRLIGLKMPHQMPGHTQIKKLGALRHSFLHAALAKFAKARRECYTNRCRGMRLRNRHQPYFLAPASTTAAGSGDSFFHPRDVFVNLFGHLYLRTRAELQCAKIWTRKLKPCHSIILHNVRRRLVALMDEC